MSLINFLKNMLNSLLDGSFERVRIINEMNKGFKELFYSGGINRMCQVSIAAGDPDFTHEMSSMSFRSGFKIGSMAVVKLAVTAGTSSRPFAINM